MAVKKDKTSSDSGPRVRRKPNEKALVWLVMFAPEGEEDYGTFEAGDEDLFFMMQLDERQIRELEAYENMMKVTRFVSSVSSDLPRSFSSFVPLNKSAEQINGAGQPDWLRLVITRGEGGKNYLQGYVEWNEKGAFVTGTSDLSLFISSARTSPLGVVVDREALTLDLNTPEFGGLKQRVGPVAYRALKDEMEAFDLAPDLSHG